MQNVGLDCESVHAKATNDLIIRAIIPLVVSRLIWNAPDGFGNEAADLPRVVYVGNAESRILLSTAFRQDELSLGVG